MATVTVHMASSLDGYIARNNGDVDWLETADDFPDGEVMEPAYVAEFLKSIDCYVMGSHTYELALSFESRGLGWVYGDKPTYVLTRRELPKTRSSVHFLEGDLRQILEERLRRSYGSIWVVGGGALCGECLRLGLADEVRYSIMPVLIGGGIPFFRGLDHDVPLHLQEVKAYKSGMIALRYAVKTVR